MELTREQAINGSKEMWTDIAETIEIRKEIVDIFHEKIYFCKTHGLNLDNHCFLCEYDKHGCDDCPVMWGEDINDMCMRKSDGSVGLYTLVCNAETWQGQAKLARKIANLPERTDV